MSLRDSPRFQTTAHNIKSSHIRRCQGIYTHSSGYICPCPANVSRISCHILDFPWTPHISDRLAPRPRPRPLYRTLSTLRVPSSTNVSASRPCTLCPLHQCQVVEVQTARSQWRTMSPGKKVGGVLFQPTRNILTAC